MSLCVRWADQRSKDRLLKVEAWMVLQKILWVAVVHLAVLKVLTFLQERVLDGISCCQPCSHLHLSSYMPQLCCHSLLVVAAEGVCLEGASSAGGFVQTWVDPRQKLLEQELLDVNCTS